MVYEILAVLEFQVELVTICVLGNCAVVPVQVQCLLFFFEFAAVRVVQVNHIFTDAVYFLCLGLKLAVALKCNGFVRRLEMGNRSL